MRSEGEIKNLMKAIDSLENQILVISPDLEILAANAAARLAIGEDCIGRYCFDIFCKEGAPCSDCHIQRMLQDNASKSADDRKVVPRRLALSCGQVTPLYAGGEMEAAVCVDIEPHHKNDTTGSEHLANAFLKTLIHSSPDAVIVASPQGNILLINEAALKLSGYTESEIYSDLNIRDVYPGEKAFDVMARLRSEHYGGPGKLKAYHVDVLEKQGQTIPIRLDAAIVYDGAKEIATLGYFRDLRHEAGASTAALQDRLKPESAKDGCSLDMIASSVARRLNLYNRQFGQTAVKIGLIDTQQLDTALEHQQQLHEKTQVAVPLGRVLVKLDYITEEQRAAILAVRALSEEERPGAPGGALADEAVIMAKELEIYNRRFGDLAIKLGFISEDQLARSLQMQKQAGEKTKIDIPLGRVLEQLEYITEEQRAAILAVQALGGKAETEVTASDPDAATLEAESDSAKNKVEAVESDGVTTEPKIKAAESKTDLAEPETEVDETRPKEGGAEPETAEPDSAESATAAAPKGDAEGQAEGADQAEAEPEERIRELFSVVISEDKLTARLIRKSRGRKEVVFDDLMDLIETEGVRHGIIEAESIRAFFDDDAAESKPLVIAQGYPPGQGKDQEVVYHFETEYLQAGKILEDGTIDWKDRGEIPQVQEGALLAELIPGVYGAAGMDVLGNEIPADPIATVNLSAGKGVKKDGDGNRYVANTKGTPSLVDNRTLSVSPILQIEGDIGIETGHIEFDGHIEVEGTIQSGYRVQGASLRAQGMNNAEAFISGNFAIVGGIFESVIKCQGNVKAVHVHKSEIDAGGDLIIDKEIIDSTVELQGTCQVEYGTIISSKIAAKNGIVAQNVGTAMSMPSHLDVGVDHKLRRELAGLKKLFAKSERQKNEITPKLKALRIESDQISENLGAAAQKQDQIMVQQRRLQDQLVAPEPLAEDLKAEHDKTVIELESQRSQIDAQVEELMAKDDALDKTIGELEDQEADITAEQAELKERMEVLRQKREAEKGKPVVKVIGDLYSGNKITGPKSKIIIEEDCRHVNIFETDKADDGQFAKWHMKIGPLR